MSLTTSQVTAFRADVKASTDPAVQTAYTAKDIDTLASLYNAPSSPAVQLWRPDIAPKEMHSAVVWSDFALLTVAKQNCYIAMLTADDVVDATSANIRSGFSTIFGAGSATLTNLTALAEKVASRFQAIAAFLTSAGAASVCSVYGYLLTRTDVGFALYDATGNPL